MRDYTKYKVIPFNTGLYTKLAFHIVNLILEIDYNSGLYAGYKTMFGDRAGQHKGFFDRDFNDWVPECSRAGVVRIQPTGEISFTYLSYRKSVTSITFKKMANVFRMFKEREIETYKNIFAAKDAADLKDGIDLYIRHFSKKLTKEDYESPLYKKYIGEPLNPFEQELMLNDRIALEQTLEKYAKGISYWDIEKEIPKDFKPDRIDRTDIWIEKQIDEKFEKFFSHLA